MLSFLALTSASLYFKRCKCLSLPTTCRIQLESPCSRRREIDLDLVDFEGLRIKSFSLKLSAEVLAIIAANFSVQSGLGCNSGHYEPSRNVQMSLVP